MEEKNMIFVEQLVKTNFVKPMRRYIKKYLKNLSVTEDVSIETINLLQQANNTINNVYKLLRKKDLVDSATLMRSCMEKIMMAMMIFFDPTETFEEFEDDELQSLLEETYEKLCLYTHSSIVVSMMIEVNKNNDEDLFALYFYLIAYFLEILIYSSLIYLTNDNKDHIDAFCIFMGFTLLCSRVDKNKLTEDYTNKYKDYLHWEINEHFTDKYKDEVEKLKNDWSNLQQEINENKEVVGNYIMNLSKK